MQKGSIFKKNMQILDRKIKKIIVRYKNDVDHFIDRLNFDEGFERLVNQAEQKCHNPKLYGEYFYPIIGYLRAQIEEVLNHSLWLLKHELDFEDCPPIKPSYQAQLRSFIHTRLSTLITMSTDKVEPAMKRFQMDVSDAGFKLNIEMDIMQLLYPLDNKIENSFSPLFNRHNSAMQPFKDSNKSNLALAISLLSIVISLIGMLRNDIWNFFFE